jgi:peptide/nickel transport system substrate-binding protein
VRYGLTGALALGSGGLFAGCDSGVSGGGGANPTRGGVLRIGVVGAGTKESLDPKEGRVEGDLARLPNLYEPLVGRDSDYRPYMQLAESVEPNRSADEWTIRLRDGVEFHNGKTVAPEDVLHSFERIVNPKAPGSAVSLLALVDFKRSKVLDKRTLRVHLSHPLGSFVDHLADQVEPIYVVPAGFDLKHPIGTGAFRYESFTPGERSVFTRNENYWGRKAYVDKLVIISLKDDVSRVNALLSGQVDAIGSLPASRIRQIQASGRFRTLISEGQNWIPIVMLTTRPPFDDRRVRQAFRLMTDRRQIAEQAFSGQAKIGNDLYSPFDPLYRQFPQRERDVEQARSLLRQAGHDTLDLEFVAAGITGGVLDVVQVFAAQAKDAGVNLSIRQVDLTTWWGNFGKWPLTMSWWLTHPFTINTIALYGKRAVYPEESFSSPHFASLVDSLTGELDESRRRQIAADIQGVLFDDSGHVIWGFPHTIDAYSAKLTGLRPNRGGVSLNNYDMKSVAFT